MLSPPHPGTGRRLQKLKGPRPCWKPGDLPPGCRPDRGISPEVLREVCCVDGNSFTQAEETSSPWINWKFEMQERTSCRNALFHHHIFVIFDSNGTMPSHKEIKHLIQSLPSSKELYFCSFLGNFYQNTERFLFLFISCVPPNRD